MRIARDPQGNGRNHALALGGLAPPAHGSRLSWKALGFRGLVVVAVIDPPTQFGHPDLPAAVQMDPAGTTIYRCFVPLVRQSQSGIARTRTQESVGLTRSRRCESYAKHTNATNWHDKRSPDSAGRARVVSANAPYGRRRRRTQSPRESGPGADGASRKAAFGLDTVLTLGRQPWDVVRIGSDATTFSVNLTCPPNQDRRRRKAVHESRTSLARPQAPFRQQAHYAPRLRR